MRTDHSAIQWLRNFKEPTGQLARWLERLAAYDFIVQHRPGRKHLNADALSRKMAADPVLAITDGENDTIDMRAEQRKDRFFSQVIQWKAEDSCPSMEEISTLDYEEKLLWARFDELIMSGDLLCLYDKDVHMKVIVPKQLRPELILKYHEGMGGGHLGFEKTLIKIKERFYWPRMK